MTEIGGRQRSHQKEMCRDEHACPSHPSEGQERLALQRQVEQKPAQQEGQEEESIIPARAVARLLMQGQYPDQAATRCDNDSVSQAELSHAGRGPSGAGCRLGDPKNRRGSGPTEDEYQRGESRGECDQHIRWPGTGLSAEQRLPCVVKSGGGKRSPQPAIEKDQDGGESRQEQDQAKTDPARQPSCWRSRRGGRDRSSRADRRVPPPLAIHAGDVSVRA